MDIGGADNTTGIGGAGGTVIILTNVTSSGDTLTVGGGKGSPGITPDNGAGIKPSSGDNTYEVYGNLTLPDNLTIPAGVTVNIPSGATLTVPSGKTLTNNGTISGEGTLNGDGGIQGTGAISVANNNFKTELEIKVKNSSGNEATSFTYGDTITVEVTPKLTSGTASTNGISALSSTDTPAVSMSYNGTQLASTTEKDSNGTYTLTYDTSQKGIQYGTNISLSISFSGGDNMVASSGTATIILSKKNINASVSGEVTKVYDQNTSITLPLTLPDIVQGDKITATIVGTFNDSQVGNNKTVTLGDVDTKGDDKLWYSVSCTQTSVTGSITAATLGGIVTIDTSNDVTPGCTLTAAYAKASDETVSYQWNRGDTAISGATGTSYTITAEDVGQQITVTATASDGNHTGSVTSSKVTPGKGTQSVPDKPVVESTATNSITVETMAANPVTGAAVQFSIDGGKTWISQPENGNTVISSLKPGTAYTVVARYAETNAYEASPTSGGTPVYTLPDITTTTPLANATVGVSYEASLSANAAEGTEVTWSITSGSLPGGLTLSTKDGVTTISGTPTAAGTATFTVQATANGVSSTKALSITVNQGTPDFGTLTVEGASGIDGSFIYGDTITVKGTVKAAAFIDEGTPGADTLRTFGTDEVALFLRGSADEDIPLTDPVKVDTDGSFTLSYDTADKKFGPADGIKLVVKYNGSSNLEAGGKTVDSTITLKAKPVTAEVAGEIKKTYDGKTDAAVTLQIPEKEKVNAGDAVLVTAKAAYISSGVEEGIFVGLTEMNVTGTDAGYYDVSLPENVTGTITAKEVTASISGTPAKTYDGTTEGPAGLNIALEGVVETDARNVSAAAGSYAYDSASVGENKTITASNITLSGTASGNYKLSGTTATITGTITKSGSTLNVTVKNGETETAEFTYGDTITLEVLPQASGTSGALSAWSRLAQNVLRAAQSLTEGEPAQDEKSTVALYYGDTRLDESGEPDANGVYTLTYNTAEKRIPTGEKQALTVKFSGDSNMNASEAAEDIRLAKKSVTAVVDGEISKVYDGTTAAEVSLKVSDGFISDDTVTGTVTGTYAGADADNNIAVTVTKEDVDKGKWSEDATWYDITPLSGITGSIRKAAQEAGPDLSSNDIEEVTEKSITVSASGSGQGGYEYVLVEGADASAPADDAEAWTAESTFNNLASGKAYTVFARFAGSQNYEPSAAGTGVTVYTAAAAPAEGEVTVDYQKETLTFGETLEVNTAKDFTGTAVMSGDFIKAYINDDGTETTLYVRAKAAGDIPASKAIPFSIPGRPDAPAPTDLTGGYGEIRGTTLEMEYSADGQNWHDCGDGRTAVENAGEYQVRFQATEESFASAGVPVSVKIDVDDPVISGIENGGTYCPGKTFTVSDEDLKAVTVNGDPQEPAGGSYSLVADEAGECIITATDEAGNETIYTVTVRHSWRDPIYQLSEDGKTCTTTRTCNVDPAHTETATAAEVSSEQSKAPTCTEKGETTYTAAFRESWAGTWTTTIADIPATGHTFSTEWKSDEERHWHECSCGAKADETAHTFGWITDKEAEIDIAGLKHEECTVCGYAREAVEIPALEAPEYPPVIGDTDGGTVTVNPENPKKGEEVTVTVEPEDGRTVDKIVVTDENGNEITVTDNGDGTYTFTQPDGKVTVKVIFEADETDKKDEDKEDKEEGDKTGKTDEAEESTPPTEEEAPDTGDSSRVIPWVMALLTSAATLAGTGIYSHKKKKYRK